MLTGFHREESVVANLRYQIGVYERLVDRMQRRNTKLLDWIILEAFAILALAAIIIALRGA